MKTLDLPHRLAGVLAAAVWVASPSIHADEVRFAVVNLSGPALPAAVVDEAEREYARLRPGVSPIAEPTMRRLLASGEAPLAAMSRLVDEAESKRNLGACDEAIPLARQAEEVALNAVSVDDNRDPLKRIYTVLVACEESLGRAEPRDRAARRLRALVGMKPDALSQELWDAHVANAIAAPPSVELQVDSEPPNAQIILNFHSEGATPRTLKVPPGELLVEIQKDGYKKAFRRLELTESRPERTVFRLTDLRHDRTDLAVNALGILSEEEDLAQRQGTLARLAQGARVDTLVLLRTADSGLRIRFFDAERGALAQEVIESAFDAETGRIEALAARETPKSARPAGGRPGVLAPVGKDGRAAKGSPGLPQVRNDTETGLAQTYKEPATVRRPNTGKAPWWGWLIAAAVAGAIATAVIVDQPRRSDTIDVNARF